MHHSKCLHRHRWDRAIFWLLLFVAVVSVACSSPRSAASDHPLTGATVSSPEKVNIPTDLSVERTSQGHQFTSTRSLPTIKTSERPAPAAAERSPYRPNTAISLSTPGLRSDRAGSERTSARVPSLESFRLSVQNGIDRQVVGIWIDGILAFRVVQGSGDFVPTNLNTASTYSWALEHNVIALLIHDYLGGTQIYQLEPGIRVGVIYGNGNLEWYVSEGITWYESEGYTDTGFPGPFRSWDCTDCEFDLSVDDLLWRHYAGTPHLTIQTCVGEDNRVGLAIFEAYSQ